MITQVVGAICGFLGLSLTSVNFLFPRPLWMIKLHTTMTALFLLVPYFLIVLFWAVVKIQERAKEWYDEKQIQDIGRSSFLTLVASTAIMGFLFFYVLRKELEYRNSNLKKDLKYYFWIYGLLAFAIAIFPYFIFFLLIRLIQKVILFSI